MTTRPVTVQGRYRLGRILGAGGMGRVWLALDETLDRDVAVKEILLPDAMAGTEQETLRRLMLREGRASARLSHPNVVQVYDAFEADGRAWIVMEYVPSRSLQQVIDQDGPLTPDHAARVGLAVLAALTTAHAAGVRHRDVKPANVLLGDDDRVVLTDFGVAAVDGESIATSSGLVVGSPQYMSPERIRDGSAEAAGDLWSLGATLYASVEGRPPYQRGSVMETVTAIAADEPEPPQRAGMLRPALDGLLRKDPGDRIDAEETERRLRAALAPHRPAPAIRRRLWAGIAAAVILLTGAVVWTLSRPDTGDADRPSGSPTTQPSVPGSTPPSRNPSPAASPSVASPPAKSSRPVLPAGWIDYRDPTGFSLYVPKGWSKSTDGSIVYFRSQGRVLGIDQTDEPQLNPVADWQGKAAYRVSQGDFPGYREIHIRSADYFLKAADWEFTFTSSGVRQHVNNRGFITSRNQAYGIWFQADDTAWSGAKNDLDLIFKSFRPDA